MPTPVPLGVLHLLISCPEVDTGDSMGCPLGAWGVHFPGPLSKDALLSFFHAQRHLCAKLLNLP